jgi:hypothetical protein
MGKNFIQTVLAIHVGIFTAGIVLDEAGRGTFGNTVQSIASKITKGFGV